MGILKKILIGFLLTLVLLVILLAGTAYVMRDKVKGIVLSEINKMVAEPINVDGPIEFSLLANFPYASVTFNDISVKNKLGKGPAYLLKVKKFSLLFNMLGLIKNKIQISRIHVYDGEFNIYIDAKGNADYEIFKPSTDTTKSSGGTALDLDVKKAVVKNLKFTYLSEGKEEDISLQIEKYTFGGDFHSDRFDLATMGNMMINLIRLNGMDYLVKKSFSADITIDVNQKEDSFNLSKANIEVDKNKFAVEGYFVGTKKKTNVNFVASSSGKDLAKLIALIPAKLRAKLAGSEGKGGYDVKAKITGDIRGGINPDIKVTAILKDAEFKIPQLRMPLEEINAEGFYHMDSVGKDDLVIKRFHSKFDGYAQDFSLSLVDLSNPSFVFDANGVADMMALRKLFADSTLGASGQIIFKQFHIEGNKNDIDNGLAQNIKASGNFTLKNVEIRSGGITYSGINGNLEYNDQDITIRGLTVSFLKASAAFDGRISNIITFAMSQSKRKNTADIALGVDGSLRVRNLNLNKIMAAYDKRGKQRANTGKAVVNAYDVFNMKGHLNISIDRFVYQKIVLENIQANLGISPYRLDINSLTTHAMGGDVSDTSYIAFTGDRRMIFTLGLHIDKIDLPVLFKECDNFSQTTLTDKNLKGRFSADVKLKTVWNNYTTIDMNLLEGTINCSVLHGELNNFEPLKAASKFIKLDELNHIVFSDLTNQLYIKNRVIHIPLMEVQSSALNMMMEGTHTFDNQIDYRIKVNLRKLLAAKFGRKENDAEYIEEDPYEGINLYLVMSGDMSHPKIRLDKKSVKQKLKNALAEQREELKETFGKDRNKKKKNEDEAKREEKYYDTRKKPEFIDFQEDTTK